MAVLLASDLFFMATGRFLWHVGTWLGLPPRCLGGARVHADHRHLHPVPGGRPGGALAVAQGVERLFGKPARRLVFG